MTPEEQRQRLNQKLDQLPERQLHSVLLFVEFLLHRQQQFTTASKSANGPMDDPLIDLLSGPVTHPPTPKDL